MNADSRMAADSRALPIASLQIATAERVDRVSGQDPFQVVEDCSAEPHCMQAAGAERLSGGRLSLPAQGQAQPLPEIPADVCFHAEISLSIECMLT